ncbi:uncharacterized protein LOC110845606 isoform X3 [Folsomia candida]|uniref:uncharacterized protein LOC110845606 isoform X3 n=1 Tax=Folsomia candida TaxID=158441 RepID=UPI001604AD1F|nr:uncharacterized protein LOC110845606 isoform X3 [Folsomia candida]
MPYKELNNNVKISKAQTHYPIHSKGGGTLKKSRPRTPLYCTAEPGTKEWREYQAGRLESIKNLKARKHFMKENASLINQIRLLARNSKSDTDAAKQEEIFSEVDANGNQYDVNDDNFKRERTLPSRGRSTVKKGILKKSLSSSSISINSIRQRDQSSQLRWKEPVIQTPPINLHINFTGKRSGSVKKSFERFPKLMSATSVSSKGRITTSGKFSKSKETRNGGGVSKTNKQAGIARDNKGSKSKLKPSKASSFTIVNPTGSKTVNAVRRESQVKTTYVRGFGHKRIVSPSPVGNKVKVRPSTSQVLSKWSAQNQAAKTASDAKPPQSTRTISNARRNLNVLDHSSSNGNAIIGNHDQAASSLSDFITRAKLCGNLPAFPDLKICNVLPGTADWDNYWDNFNGQVAQYNKSMDKYTRGMSEFSQELEAFSRKLKRSTLDDLVFQAQLGMLPGEKKPPMLRQLLTLPLTLVGPYVIKRDIKSKGVSSPTVVHLTSFDHQSFRMEISLVALQGKDDEDSKYNMLLVRIELSPKTTPEGSVVTYKEEIQIAVPPEKNVFADLQVSSSLQNSGKIIINGK